MAIKDFSSQYEYRKHLAAQKGLTRHEYQKQLAMRKGYSSLSEYKEFLARQRGFSGRNEYELYLAKQKGFESIGRYKESLAGKRQQRPLNRKLSSLIQQQLTALDKTQKWLAEQLGITEGVVSRYVSGRITPKQRSLQRKLFSILKLPYETLDALVQ